MKLMDISSLNALSNALNGVDIGESILYGRVEAYSCTLIVFKDVKESLRPWFRVFVHRASKNCAPRQVWRLVMVCGHGGLTTV